VRRKDFGETAARWRWLFWETLIIVLGVLIAFAINDYWSDRNDRELELQYLMRLHSNLKGDEEWAKNYVENSIPIKMAALDAIAPVVRGKQPVPEDVEDFLNNVTLGGIGGVSPTYFVIETTFDDLTATGNLRLIRDVELRNKFNIYYIAFGANYARVLARTTGYSKYVHSILPAEKRQDFNMEAIEEFGAQRAIDRILSTEFEDLLGQEYNYAYFIQRMYPIFASRSMELADELDAHIRQLKNQ